MREVTYRDQKFSHALGRDDRYFKWCHMSFAYSDWRVNVETLKEDVSDWWSGSDGETLRCDADGGSEKIAMKSMVVTLVIRRWGSIIRATLMLLLDCRIHIIQGIHGSWRGLGLLVWSIISCILLDACCLVIQATNTSSWFIWRSWRMATRGCVIILGEGWHWHTYTTI